MYQTPKRKFTYVSLSILLFALLTVISVYIVYSQSIRLIFYFHSISSIYQLLFLSMLFSMFVSFLIIQFVFRRKWSLQLHWKPNTSISLREVFICFLFGFGLNLFFSFLLSFSFDTFSFNSLYPSVYHLNMYSPSTLLFIFTIVIASPLFEEFLFRGIVLMTLKPYGNWFAIIISSLLFTMMHGTLTQTISLFFLAIAIGYLVVKTNSLFFGILLHMVNNALAILPFFFHSEFIQTVYSLLLILIMITGCILLVIFFLHHKKIYSSLTSPYDYSIKQFFNNWASITLIILLSVAIVYSSFQSL